ncbi:MAG: PIG-L family deacetylase [Cyclobacteriaceae bacterium]|nr:PIG-L family deacetylase [Cyclobacteriaceae bacterium]
MKSVAMIVAHPDDETLWAGGTILINPHWNYFIVCLCRANDEDRSHRFYEALKILRAKGTMGDLNDDPEQLPIGNGIVENLILQLLPKKDYDLVITHDPAGEYTRHLRHEETGQAVIRLWQAKKISTKKLWTFAYDDGNKNYIPRPIKKANIYRSLTKPLWQKKYDIIHKTYGFREDSWEARVTSKNEAFWQFNNAALATSWLKKLENKS